MDFPPRFPAGTLPAGMERGEHMRATTRDLTGANFGKRGLTMPTTRFAKILALAGGLVHPFQFHSAAFSTNAPTAVTIPVRKPRNDS